MFQLSELSLRTGLLLVIAHDLFHDNLFFVKGVIAANRILFTLHLATVLVEIVVQHKSVVATLTLVLLQLISCALPPESTVGLVRNRNSGSSRIIESVFSTKRIGGKAEILIVFKRVCNDLGRRILGLGCPRRGRNDNNNKY